MSDRYLGSESENNRSNYDQYSSNYDYEDEEYSLSEDLEDLNSKKINPEDYNPRMNTKGTTVEVSAGTTIRLNCDIENLHGRHF